MCNATNVSVPKSISNSSSKEQKNEVEKDVRDADILKAERELKKAKHSKFFWEDNQEPHVERYVRV